MHHIALQPVTLLLPPKFCLPASLPPSVIRTLPLHSHTLTKVLTASRPVHFNFLGIPSYSPPFLPDIDFYLVPSRCTGVIGRCAGGRHGGRRLAAAGTSLPSSCRIGALPLPGPRSADGLLQQTFLDPQTFVTNQFSSVLKV